MTLAEFGHHLFNRIITYWTLALITVAASYVVQEQNASETVPTVCERFWICDTSPTNQRSTR